MSCMTLFAAPVTMATTQLKRMIHYEDALAGQLEGNVDHQVLSMSSVVVTDRNGNRRLQIQWHPQPSAAEGVRHSRIPVTFL